MCCYTCIWFDLQKDTVFVLNLLRLIAFQIGHDISYSEIASRLHVNVRTVQRYLNILEKMYIIFSLSGFSRNMRNEYTKTPRYYFWDNGIRNSLISNLNPIHIRNDSGQLWENYCIAERQKFLSYNRISANRFFWRTYTQKEIDYLEERDDFDSDNVHYLGMSFGAIYTPIVLLFEDRFNSAVLLSGGLDPYTPPLLDGIVYQHRIKTPVLMRWWVIGLKEMILISFWCGKD